ncbi:hypothetical protein RSOLAG22IIIB_11872 [Rhizoctonia solani]|uniref:Uncharacterized protein n=1 Tax=Rhizoctonia solani TaxID=456999 RepID=A0A0K6GAH2_9AGAM|nr:hypothetical protein RSOLAG22IIIB_11872 [Rhizoctonia solani]
MPRKSTKARGKARARRTPSPSPSPTLTPPPTGRRGRPAGAGTYSSPELRLLLNSIEKCQPTTTSDWSKVEKKYNAGVPRDRQRRAENLKTRFHKLVCMPKPTGDPEANRLHEDAVMIDEELEGLEHTHILDDPPALAASRGSTVLSISDSEFEILDEPVPPPRATRPSTSSKRNAEASTAFRAVARKVGPGSRPAQSRGFLDAATSQIASVFSPAAEERFAGRQRNDLTIITLNDTIRDLRAELSQERERRFALERQLRDEEMRRIVEQQVQQQLRHHIPTHHPSVPVTQPPAPSSSPNRLSNPPQPWATHHSDGYPTAGNAHPSWMPGPPPNRSDASGSGGA